MKLLCLDRGNSSLKGILYQDDQAIARLNPALPEKEALRELLSMELEGIALCSVRPSEDVLIHALAGEVGQKVWQVKGDSPTPFPVDIDKRKTLGPDRICNAAAAVFQKRNPVVIVDAGTAITLDLVDLEGVFRGGAILPGPRLWLASLAGGTELLGQVEPNPKVSPLGRHSQEALQAGLLGMGGAVQELILRLGDLLSEDFSVILTGGASAFLADTMPDLAFEREADWTLEGLRFLHKESRP
ncbi:MAG: type III pantothenate kinase [Candidatus Krumholzibacteria bacterium]|jgi:type III pantothenate kinase|nr:type III pantothenate kinase [Candidatus Krumholzibacteria bacterium]MDP6669225.1 type III pantothenate kinase [Candidatus Krumholzibacteria bacterium]MDP6796468.1 type III pantothenate kinase [Candidatus Krumholzibacteria bacterium]MDP7021598.1 type III pantothenate kinase [Candidatus Krumholzibacteria bacterium]